MGYYFQYWTKIKLPQNRYGMQIKVRNAGIYIVPSFFALKNRSIDVSLAIVVRKIAIFHQFFTPIFVHEEVEIIITHAEIVAHGLLFLKIR